MNPEACASNMECSQEVAAPAQNSPCFACIADCRPLYSLCSSSVSFLRIPPLQHDFTPRCSQWRSLACHSALCHAVNFTPHCIAFDGGPCLTGRRLLFENAQQSLQAIQSLPSYQHMLLQPFSHEEVQEYMCVALDRHDITDQIAAAVHERTGGLPLYVEQVTTPPHLPACHLTLACCHAMRCVCTELIRIFALLQLQFTSVTCALWHLPWHHLTFD